MDAGEEEAAADEEMGAESAVVVPTTDDADAHFSSLPSTIGGWLTLGMAPVRVVVVVTADVGGGGGGGITAASVGKRRSPRLRPWRPVERKVDLEGQEDDAEAMMQM